jgi:hypothetical protein
MESFARDRGPAIRVLPSTLSTSTRDPILQPRQSIAYTASDSGRYEKDVVIYLGNVQVR